MLAACGTAVVGSLAGCVDSLGIGGPEGTEWTTDVTDTFDPAPLVASETVVAVGVRDGGIEPTRVHAVEKATGESRWTADLGRLTGTAVDDDHVYVGLHGGDGATVVAFDLRSGDRVWERRVDSLASATALDDGTLYVANRGLTAIDTADGSVRWHRNRLDGTRFTILAAPEDQLTASDGRVYYGGGGGVVAVDGSDGTERWTWSGEDWRTTTAGPDRFDGSTGDGERVYVGGEDAVSLARLDAGGTERWTRGFGRARVAGIHAEGVLQVATGTRGGFGGSGRFGTVYEVDPADGSETDEFRFDAPIRRTASSDESFVVVTEENEVSRFESDGTGPDLRHTFDAGVTAGTDDDGVYVHTDDGRLLAVDATG
nr:PQQ-binding-like beta-propeller repeat protein [Salinirubrum litoreum]